jgi:hypothetical protein
VLIVLTTLTLLLAAMFAALLAALLAIVCCLPSGGVFEYKMEFPVSSVHMMQVTGRDEFLLIVSVGPCCFPALPAAIFCAALS